MLLFLAPPGALIGVVFPNVADNLPLSLRYPPPQPQIPSTCNFFLSLRIKFYGILINVHQ